MDVLASPLEYPPAKTAAPCRGFYINLDDSPARRARIETQLSRHLPGCDYRRHAAIDGAAVPPRGKLSPGALGCYLSHLTLLESQSAEAGPLHVLEDDALLCAATLPAITHLIGIGALGQFDLIFTDTFIPLDSFQARLHYRLFEACRSGTSTTEMRLQVLTLRDRPWAGTVSYLVAPGAAPRVAAALRRRFEEGPKLPLDLTLRELVDAQQLRAAVLFPFVTSLDLAVESTINDPTGRRARGRLAVAILRQLFFVQPDYEAIERLIDEHLDIGPAGPRERALARLLAYVVCGDFQPP